MEKTRRWVVLLVGDVEGMEGSLEVQRFYAERIR